MHLLCAWCRQEGKPGYLGMFEPLEDPGLTHGICADHKEQLLESMPSRSFPDAELLIVVHRNNITLYEHLQRWVAGAPAVKVLLDRPGRRRAPAREKAADSPRHDLSARRLHGGAIHAESKSLRVRATRLRCRSMHPSSNLIAGSA